MEYPFSRPLIMAVVNLTPDSFMPHTIVASDEAAGRIETLLSQGADIIDLGAVSTRPGAADVDVEEEWRRLEPALASLGSSVALSIDTTSSEIVARAHALLGRDFIVNDISAGEDDPAMLPLVGRLGLVFVAMHKRGNPRSMDSLCEYPEGVVQALCRYFDDFAQRAEACGVSRWILDPGLGFAKTTEQNWALLEGLNEFRRFAKPILTGAADKRFTGGDTARADALALSKGADILRVHDVAAAVKLRSIFLSQKAQAARA